MKNYKLIIFDFDGTLADSFGWFAGNINKAAAKFKFRMLEESEHDQLRHYDSKEVMRHLNIPWWKVPFIANYMRKLMSDEISEIDLFHQIDEILEEIAAKNVEMAVVSSNSYDNVVRILGDKARLIKYFECGVSLFGKCSRFKKIIKRSGHGHHQIICIGDEIRDIEAAKQAKLKAGSVTWGYAGVLALKARSPDHLFSSVGEIPKIL